MTELLVLKSFIDHKSSIDSRHGNFGLCWMPADGVDNLFLTFRLRRVKVSIIDCHKFHVV